MLRRVVIVRTDDLEELSASFIKVTRIGELGETLDVTMNRRRLQRNTWYFFAACVGCCEFLQVRRTQSVRLKGKNMRT
jgi:hypothetical protein